MFTKYLPKTPVFITFGNNDTPVHYNLPLAEHAKDYYQFIFDLWFKNHPANRKFAPQALKTFMKGGYYKIDITNKFSFLAFNTLPFNKKQLIENIGSVAKEEFQWIEGLFNEPTSRKYIIATHITAGASAKEGMNHGKNWRDEWRNRYYKMLTKNPHKLLIEVAGHTHIENMRVDTFWYHKNRNPFEAYRNVLIGTGMCPRNGQMPGFNTFKVDHKNQLPKSLIETSMDIFKMIGKDLKTVSNLKNIPVYEVDYEKQYGFKYLNGSSMRQTINNLTWSYSSINRLNNYMASRLGFDPKNPASFK